MRLIPRELDKLIVSQVGWLAQRRLCRGVKLNRVETIGLISFVLLELVRDGNYSVADLMDKGKAILGRRHVLEGVPEAIHDIQLEATFPDGSFLITVHEPISSQDGDFELALYSSFLPVPNNIDELFPVNESASPMDRPELNFGNEEPIPDGADETMPEKRTSIGPYYVGSEPIVLCPGRKRRKLTIKNVGDRPIQVGSHYHFIETNSKLKFDRKLAYGMRLDIPSGTSIRFEPGDARQVQMVEIGGSKKIEGGNNLASGLLDTSRLDGIINRMTPLEFGHEEEGPPSDPLPGDDVCFPKEVDRGSYCSMFGPTVGDRVRLGDSNLIVEVERDCTVYGDESKFGGGKVLREGMGQATGYHGDAVVDLLITNALIIDYTGIYKADIGIKDGRIQTIGKGGNPAMMDGVDIICGAGTEVLAAEGLIVTAGAIDAHVHFICPQLCDEALAGGITTLIGGGTGPATGTCATTCTPGANNLHTMFRSTDGFPLNFGFTGKGNSADMVGLLDQIEAGAVGLKLHEDWGTTPAAIDACLKACDKHDVQATIHTDTLNESGYVEATIKAIGGRTIHTYHTEGAGGGHAPDIIKVCGLPHVLPSSTNPTRPYTTNTLDEHVDMLMVCHHLDSRIPEDVAFAESRIRSETIAAEDVLHDLGAISIISSDAQAMGRVGEVVSRTWKTAHKMKAQRGALPPEPGCSNLADNFRVRRYIAKYTINPALAHGIAHEIGSVEEGKWADLVLYQPSMFGTKPEYVIKGGQIVRAQMGDANASIPTTQPLLFRPMYSCTAVNSLLLVSKASITNGSIQKLNLTKRAVAVRNCRSVSKADLKWNSFCPEIDVDPETYQVTVNGELCTSLPAGKNVNLPLPLNQKHFLF